MLSIKQTNNLDEWLQTCPDKEAFNDRFIDVKKWILTEINHFKLKVTDEEIDQVTKAFMSQDWSENGSFILYLISEVQAGNL